MVHFARSTAEKCLSDKEWRRGRDSNPRYGLSPYNGLANPVPAKRRGPQGHEYCGFPSISAWRKDRAARVEARAKAARDSAQYDPRSGKPRKSLAEILARHTVAESGCWEWDGGLNGHGYGLVGLMIDGKISTMAAHRLQWMRVKGRIPDGLDVCHTCDNRRCINPAHLWLGTAADNIHDMIAKGRANFQGLKYSGRSAQKTAQEAP